MDPIISAGDYTNPDLEESFEDDMRGQGFDVTLDLSHESNDRISEREVRRLLPRMIKAYPPEDYFYTFGTVTVNGGNPSHEDIESALATAFSVGDIIDSLGDDEEEEEEDNKRKIKSAYSVSSNGAAIFPKSLREIAEDAFEGRKTLKTAQIPAGVTSIGECAFAHCSGLKSVVIPARCKVGEEAFPEGVKIIRRR